MNKLKNNIGIICLSLQHLVIFYLFKKKVVNNKLCINKTFTFIKFSNSLFNKNIISQIKTFSDTKMAEGRNYPYIYKYV